MKAANSFQSLIIQCPPVIHRAPLAGRSFALPACSNSDLGSPAKQFLKESLGPLQSLLGEDDRFGLAARVGDVALLTQSVQRIPVEAFPGPCPVVQSHVE